jgi:hypothetical protein
MRVPRPYFVQLPPLSDAQVSAGARPGESWEQARDRLGASNFALPPEHHDMDPGADCTGAGWIDESEGLDGKPIEWENGELGAWHYE